MSHKDNYNICPFNTVFVTRKCFHQLIVCLLCSKLDQFYGEHFFFFALNMFEMLSSLEHSSQCSCTSSRGSKDELIVVRTGIKAIIR